MTRDVLFVRRLRLRPVADTSMHGVCDYACGELLGACVVRSSIGSPASVFLLELIPPREGVLKFSCCVMLGSTGGSLEASDLGAVFIGSSGWLNLTAKHVWPCWLAQPQSGLVEDTAVAFES